MQASHDSDDDPHAPRVIEVKSQETESEEEGESIEGVEFESADESSDEETFQDRAMIDDNPREEENEVVQYGRMNAAVETDSAEESLPQVLVRLKRRAPAGATKPCQSRRRRRVILSSSDSSGEEEGSLPPVRSQALRAEAPPVLEKGGLGTDSQMPDAPALESEDDDLPPEPEEDDGWSDFFDLSLEDDFARACVIVPRPRWASSPVSTLPLPPLRFL